MPPRTLYATRTAWQQAGCPQASSLRKAHVLRQVEPQDAEAAAMWIEITNASEDREGDIIAIDGWNVEFYLGTAEHPGNPVILFAHDYHALPIARTEELRIEGTRMLARPVFPDDDTYPFGALCGRLLQQGFLNAASVGFAPEEWSYDEDRRGYNFLRQELLEFSIVTVPANPLALVDGRQAGLDMTPMMRWADDALQRESVDGLAYTRPQIERLYKALSPQRRYSVPRAGGGWPMIQKEGRVLSAANEERLRRAQDLHAKGLAAHKSGVVRQTDGLRKDEEMGRRTGEAMQHHAEGYDAQQEALRVHKDSLRLHKDALAQHKEAARLHAEAMSRHQEAYTMLEELHATLEAALAAGSPRAGGGLLLPTLSLKAESTEAPTFRESLRQAMDMMQEGLAHQDEGMRRHKVGLEKMGEGQRRQDESVQHQERGIEIHEDATRRMEDGLRRAEDSMEAHKEGLRYHKEGTSHHEGGQDLIRDVLAQLEDYDPPTPEGEPGTGATRMGWPQARQLTQQGVIPPVDKGVSPADVSDKKAPEDEAWSAPTLGDFTDESWDTLSESDKRTVAGHYAWAAEMPPATFGDLKLPHHRVSDGAVVWRGVANAAARLPQSSIPDADVAKVQAHLGRHYKAFDKTPPWEAQADAWQRYARMVQAAKQGTVPASDAECIVLLHTCGFAEEAELLEESQVFELECDEETLATMIREQVSLGLRAALGRID